MKLLLVVLFFIAVAYCSLSGLYLNNDWLGGAIGGVIGFFVSCASGVLFAHVILNLNKEK